MSEAHDELLPDLDLRLTEENLEDLYENSPCGYCSCLPDGTFVKINDTLLQWLGYAREDLVARQTFQQLLIPQGLPEFETSFWSSLLQTDKKQEVSTTLRQQDGSPLPMLLNAVLLRDANLQPLVIRMTLFSIKDRLQYEQELIQAKTQAEEQAVLLRRQNDLLTRINAELDNFVYTASHDLKQPVHNLTGLFEEFKRNTTFHDSAGAGMITMFTESLQQIRTTIDGLTEIVQKVRQL
jgi:PAS domain S-box-containing protein